LQAPSPWASRLGDFNGNGRLDILFKSYSHNAPRIDILLNGGT
jgi:hypothetical protein